jgi:hypothetical protein
MIYRFVESGIAFRLVSVHDEALLALRQWSSTGAGRSFKVIEEDDGQLLVRLSFDSADSRADPDLRNSSSRHGVRHEFVRFAERRC